MHIFVSWIQGLDGDIEEESLIPGELDVVEDWYQCKFTNEKSLLDLWLSELNRMLKQNSNVREKYHCSRVVLCVTVCFELDWVFPPLMVITKPPFAPVGAFHAVVVWFYITNSVTRLFIYWYDGHVTPLRPPIGRGIRLLRFGLAV